MSRKIKNKVFDKVVSSQFNERIKLRFLVRLQHCQTVAQDDELLHASVPFLRLRNKIYNNKLMMCNACQMHLCIHA